MTLVGKKFPNLNVTATDKTGQNQTINILEEAQKNNKKVILFWYPKDFTFVCPTELYAFEAAVAEFEKRNTIVIGASCDTPEVHFAWLNTPKNQGGIQGVSYKLIADSNRNLASTLGILDITNETYNEETGVVTVEGDNVTYRATYLIDEEGTVFHEGVNHMPVGRNVSEFLRLIDAYAHVQENGEVCPANWQEGDKAMTANRDGVAEYLAAHVN
ncbi:peroxiredoxin [Olleya aquimaris]|uniref:Thioredoxin peroxidase n=1 Tax=Olleya aquimaris TaxID=639310 RepID=A0A327RNI1_9FLAO|nr:peroxiredoxin [Olleya aquimaris]RAJ17174.1 peroxiredoxin (alkyl hydroperoxide reductase subunit C) [Olleya aquimaris]